MKNSLIAFVLLFSTFGFSQEKAAGAPKIGIKVPQGEAVVLNNITIKFIEVVEDSRCPKGVDCMWAGRAVVKVEVSQNGKTEEKTMTFGDAKPGEENNTNLYNSANYVINGLTLNPYPTSESTGKDTGYVLIVCEEKS